ncbi:type II/IV secretion system ATPase subunit [Methanohalobium sp.]|uniref:type II/IV secretion system ATPase subunit n=1 Tax=Methanohalobium sp. TaxID=2837493 RepID=UPI0025D5EB81|nr:type II/IV secretion system ATPase subunit [Methanohalobium sp.]
MAEIDPEFKKSLQRNPHLAEYIKNFQKKTGIIPEFRVNLTKDISAENVNIILPVGDPVFIHLYGTPQMGQAQYYAIEPTLSSSERKKYDVVMNTILEKSAKKPVPESESELKDLIIELLNDSVDVGSGGELPDENGKLGMIQKLIPSSEQVPLTQNEYNKLLYHIERNVIGSGPLEPVIRDPYLEDIHSVGVNGVYIVHKILDMIKTNIHFGDDSRLDDWFRSMSERIGRPVNDASPISDGALPDGSRINMIYSTDISLQGSSFTMRKFSDTPISIIQLMNFGSINTEMAAYIWMCFENGMSVFFSGETASGKTTMLNACLAFINPWSKVYSAEDTSEVQPPQDVWQQLLTREEGPEESRVELYTLLKAALRSRPNYIIVGEIRGVEGSVAFQAMQTGHPVVSTFHAASVKKLIQRLTGHPINVPITFIDNLQVTMILQAVYRKGEVLRRCISIEEIEGYSEESNGVVTRGVFEWDPEYDIHHFRGLNNSFVLESKIASILGYEDKRQVYDDLFLRARILEEMQNRGIEGFYEVYDIIKKFYKYGLEGLPFSV